MKKLSLLICILTLSIFSQTFGQSIQNPEAVVLDYEYERWLISNYNQGCIMQLDLDGNVAYFTETGLDHPRGMKIINGVLYVTVTTELKGFNLATGAVVYSLFIPEEDFLNDIESDDEGHLYMSGTLSSKVHKVYLATSSHSVFANVGYAPNGLLMDKVNNRLLICHWGANAPIKAIDLSDSTVSTIVNTGLSDLDGLARNAKGDIFVSSQGNNAIYRYDPDFINPPELIAGGFNTICDICIEPNSDLLAAADMMANSIEFRTTQMGGNLINVPEDQTTIQAAIDVSIDGDMVLVNSGTYFENLNYKGKNIDVTSRYVFNNNPEYITNTIIDGGNPVHPDTASCVLFVNGEAETAIIQGFTITGGTGTKWLDEHGAGLFTEGGGILVTYASPTIKNNKIMFNAAVNTNGTVSAGGGAIRCGDSNPLIENNLIAHNQGRYGGGIVLNYSGAVIRNNIIDSNSGGEDFGGGGVWMVGNASDPKILTNNTITNNHSESTAGGIRIWSAIAEITNTIIWGNTAGSAPQIQGNGGIFSYCDIEGGWSGEQNIDEDPMFDNSNFYLMTGSPCIDAGNPDTEYNDPEDTSNPGQAEFPSKGNLRNDMGAYGGPHRKIEIDYLTKIKENSLLNSTGINFTLFPNPCSGPTYLQFTIDKQSSLAISQEKINCDLFEISGAKVMTLFNETFSSGEHKVSVDLKDIPAGVYFCVLKTNEGIQTRKVIKIE